MPLVNKVRTARIKGQSVVVDSVYKDWKHSPRSKSGALLLRTNPFVLSTNRLIYHRSNTDAYGDVPQGGSFWRGPNLDRVQREVQAQAYARFRGKLYSGSAALGVTFATAKQAREMVNQRVDTLKTDVTQLYADAHRAKRAGRDASGLILETFFGWIPLYSDIHAATTSVIQEADQFAFVRGAASSFFEDNKRTKYAGNRIVTMRSTGNARFSQAAVVRIKNPNLWLTERAGLLNYGAVVWDLVPWSFLVNAFSNTGSLVGSLTDYAGLAFEGYCESRQVKCRFFGDDYTPPNDFWKLPAEYKRAESVHTDQHRYLASGPSSPPLIWRVPELNWSTAAIGLSLVTQQVTRLIPLTRGLSRLISKTK